MVPTETTTASAPIAITTTRAQTGERPVTRFWKHGTRSTGRRNDEQRDRPRQQHEAERLVGEDGRGRPDERLQDSPAAVM